MDWCCKGRNKKNSHECNFSKNDFCIFTNIAFYYQNAKLCNLIFGIENYPPPLIFIQEKLNCIHFKLICTCKRSCIRLYEMRRRSSRVADCGFASCKKENQFTLYRQLCATFQKGLYFPLGKNLANLKSGFPRCCSALSCSRCLQRNGEGGVKPEIKIYVIPFCDEESLKNQKDEKLSETCDSHYQETHS